MQLLSLADENVVSVSGSYELFAYFFHSGYHGGTDTTLGRDVGLVQSSEGQHSVDLNSRLLFSAGHFGNAHGWTEMEPRDVVWVFCSFVVLLH